MCDCEEKAKKYIVSILGSEPIAMEGSYVDRLIDSHRSQRGLIRDRSDQAQNSATRMRFFPERLRRWLLGYG